MTAHATHAGGKNLFDDDAVLDVELIGPIDTLLDSRPDDEELAFVLRREGERIPVAVRLRGKSRLTVCRFPPIRLNFAAEAVAGTLFEGQDKLKLVTHCRKSDSSQQDALLEYAAYRMLNLISDVSYRVRLLRVTYTDSEDDGDVLQRYGFVIESDDELAARTGLAPLRVEGVARTALNAEQAARVFVFQYLIGNTDWSVVKADGEQSCCHNGDLFGEEGNVYFVPYDFDQAGLVNTRYAAPDPSLPINRVTRRLYRGYCIPEDKLRRALERIAGLRADIEAIPGSIPGLSAREIEKAEKFIGRFFERAQDQQALQADFQRRCL